MNSKHSKENSKKPLLVLGVAFLVGAASLSVASLAWFMAPRTQVDSNGIEGAGTGSYFAGGDGEKDTPYQIATPKQLYYFNWLQDLGYFNKYETAADGSETKAIKQVYFVLNNSIDASGYILPPRRDENVSLRRQLRWGGPYDKQSGHQQLQD